MLKRIFSTLALTCGITSMAVAGAPQTMSYQGMLTDGVDPVADAVYSVTFTLWDAAAAGNSKWAETQNVTTSDGLFLVALGTVNSIPDSVFNQTTRWLGVKVDADPEMTPRTELSSVPYAARIATLDGASGGSITGEMDLRVPCGAFSAGAGREVANAGICGLKSRLSSDYVDIPPVLTCT